jgi:glycosidase
MNGNNYCVCGQGCAWDGSDGKRCWFTDYLPDFNFNNQAARDFSVSNAMQWIVDTGVDGFRLDAVKHIEDSWLLDLRARVKTEIEPQTQQHFYMVGETFTGDKNTIAYYVDPSNMLDGQFDFPMRNALVSAVMMRSGTMYDLEGFLAGNDGFYGAGIMSTFIGNHDVPRSIHFAQDVPLWSDPWADGKDKAWSGQPGLPAQQSAFERMVNAFAILFTLPGVPLIYYGDEVGMPGAGDPDNRRFMQWSGYSQGQQLLKDRIAKLSAIRAAHPALRRGSRATLTVTNDTLAYSMTEGGDVVVVVVNRGDGSANVGGLPAGSYVDALDNSSHTGSSVSVPARSTRILVAN